VSTRNESLPTKICFKCGVQSVTGGEHCPSCGAPYGRRRGTFVWILLGVLLFLVLLVYLTSQTLTGGSSSSLQPSSKQYPTPHTLRT
jgi:hypothetical protein